MVAPVFESGSRIVEALFGDTQGARRNKSHTFQEGPVETLIGHFSTDWSYLRFLDNLSVDLTKRLPEEVDDLGRVTGSGVRSNFYGLRYVAGYAQIPATYPLVDNTLLRAKEGLSNKWVESWHENCARALTRLFFSDLKPKALRLRKNSSSMMPMFEKELSRKIELARFALQNGERAGELMMKGDFVTPWVEWYIGGAYSTVHRNQANDKATRDKDGWHTKERPVADRLFAISGGAQGTYAPGDRTLTIEGKRIPDGFFRQRNRVAMGGPLGLNANMMIIAQPVRERIYTEFAYTYHHTTRQAQQTDIRKMDYIIAADVSNHDWFWPTFVIDLIAEELLNMGFAPWWVELYKVRIRMPNFVNSVGPGHDSVLLGDWRKPSNQGGLPSGNAFTDLDGSWLMTLVYFFVQVEHTYPELIKNLQTVEDAERTLRAYLKGNLPIVLKDKSDDALLGWTEPRLRPRVHALHERMKKGEAVSAYMKVSYEHGGAFLGSVLLYPKDGNSDQITLIGNINSLVINQFSPEYGVQSAIRDRTKAKRPYPGLAWETMSAAYGSSPAYGEVLELIEYHYGKVYGSSYSVFREKWLAHDKDQLRADLARVAKLSVIPDLSLADADVLTDPTRLEWKYAEEDVNPLVVSLTFGGLPLEDVVPFFNAIYKDVNK